MLSDTWLRKNLGKPVEKELTKNDRDGLSARIRENGLITFVLRIYLADGQRIKMTLGKYPNMTLKEARDKAIHYKNLAAEGHDPRTKRKAEILHNSTSPTVDYIFDYWYQGYAIHNKKSHELNLRSYELHVQKELGDLTFSDLSRHHWINLLRKIANDKPQIAARLKSDLKQMAIFAYDSALIESSAALEGISKKMLGIKSKEGSRTFNDDDIRLFYSIINHQKNFIAKKNKIFMELGLFYGCRLGELRITEQSWLDFEKMTWTVPKEYHKTGTKTNESIVRPILPEMKYLWEQAIAESNSDTYVFTKMATRSIKGSEVMTHGATIGIPKNIQKFYQINLLGTDEKHMEEWEHWSNHDLRRTARSYWSALGDFITVEKMLGHSMKGVHGIYDKYSYLPEMTEVYKKWWAILKAFENGDKKVVPFTPKTGTE